MSNNRQIPLPPICIKPPHPEKQEQMHLKVYIMSGILLNVCSVYRMTINHVVDLETNVLRILNSQRSISNHRYQYRDMSGDWIELDGSEISINEMRRHYKMIQKNKRSNDITMKIRVFRDSKIIPLDPCNKRVCSGNSIPSGKGKN